MCESRKRVGMVIRLVDFGLTLIGYTITFTGLFVAALAVACLSKYLIRYLMVG